MMKYKSQLIIKHFGAIKEIDIEINKINVIIGNQSSGKSTIAKVLSFCQWVEKRYIIEGKFNYTIKDMLQNFHRIGDEYFHKDTYVEYNSEALKISFDNKKKINIVDADKSRYYKSKNIYIPAERNFATIIPNLGRYNETSDNIMNLLYDWNDAKKQYLIAKDILNLGISFSYSEKDDEDYLHFLSERNDKSKMPLRLGSSGLQSVIPVILLFDYLTILFYKKRKPLSVFEKELVEYINNQIKEYTIDKIEINKKRNLSKEEYESNVKMLVEKMLNDFNSKDLKISTIKGLTNNISEYHFSRFIIEEPEQNLYPQTQRDLIYYLLKVLNEEKREHQLFLTTHSPFILYSLNNCMMGYQIKTKMPNEEQEDLASRLSWINPELISIWQLEDGILKSIKNETTNVIGTHSFNSIMNSVMGEYYEMLGYFGDAE